MITVNKEVIQSWVSQAASWIDTVSGALGCSGQDAIRPRQLEEVRLIDPGARPGRAGLSAAVKGPGCPT